MCISHKHTCIYILYLSHCYGMFVIYDMLSTQYYHYYFILFTFSCELYQPKVDNNLGTQNNVTSVQPSDFEVFEALAVDSLNSGDKGKACATAGLCHRLLCSRLLLCRFNVFELLCLLCFFFVHIIFHVCGL